MDQRESNVFLETSTGTVSEALDRLEILAGKIGLNTAQQSLSLLHGLDTVYTQMQGLEAGTQSRRLAETQFDEIVTALRNEGRQFLRDLGGPQVLRQERAKVNPPTDHTWWYLDAQVSGKRRAALNRVAITAGAVVLILAILAFVYQRFLAPDPIVAARYGHENSATTLLINSDYAGAEKEVDQGLQLVPDDPTLLIMKGVLLDHRGQADQAKAKYAAAEKSYPQRADFYIDRGQMYLMVDMPEKALADAKEAVRLNPQSANAYMLDGQVNEAMQRYQPAMDDYNKAFDVASKNGQSELMAMARTRLAMVLQKMNGQANPDLQELTPTP